MLKNLRENETSRKRIVLYPHDINIVKRSALKAEVKNTYFKGENFLIQAKLNGEDILVENKSDMNAGEIINLSVSEKLIKERLN